MALANSKGKIISVTPVVTVGAYHANDCVGGKLTLTDALVADGGSALLTNVVVVDDANQKAALEVVFFNANPAAATLTDNAAIVFSTDLAKVIARVPITAADWATVGDAAVADVQCLRTLEGVSGNNLYAAVMTTGTPTFGAAGDLTFRFGLDRY